MVLGKHCTKNEVLHKDLVTLTAEILNGKLHFLCSDIEEHKKVIIRKNRQMLPKKSFPGESERCENNCIWTTKTIAFNAPCKVLKQIIFFLLAIVEYTNSRQTDKCQKKDEKYT